MASTTGKIFLPKQRVRKGRGVAGYKGKNIVVLDEKAKPVVEETAPATLGKKKSKGE